MIFQSPAERGGMINIPYREAEGMLLWLSLGTLSDIYWNLMRRHLFHIRNPELVCGPGLANDYCIYMKSMSRVLYIRDYNMKKFLLV